MKAPVDRIHQDELLRAFAIYDSCERNLLEALAREGGESNVATLSRVARLVHTSLASAALALANVITLRSQGRFPFVQFVDVNLSEVRTFALPDETRLRLTATGWQAVQLIGYGHPALIVPESHGYAPEIAEPDAEAHRARLQMQHPLTVWSIEPEVPFHEA